MKKIAAALALILSLSACGNSGTEFETNEQSFISGNGIATFISIEKRVAAPAISGPALAGGDVRSESGKVRVINVWASWCSPCRAEAPALEELSKAHPEVQFIGILTRDSVVTARAFVERFGITYPTLIDDSILVKFHGQLTPNAIPTTLIIDKENRIAARISGEISYTGLEDLIKKIGAE